MPKTRTTITISKDLLKKAREKEVNISSFVDIELRRYLALTEGKIHSETEQDGLGRIRTGGLRRVRAMS
jgi:post-segregation antitoxin (ccd killing protein)